MVSVKTHVPDGGICEDDDLSSWMFSVAEHYNAGDVVTIKRACIMAYVAYKNRKTESGETFIHNAITVADILVHLGMDAESVAAALMIELVDKAIIGHDEIEAEFGKEIAHLVTGVTRMRRIHQYQEQSDVDSRLQNVEGHAENLRKLLLAMVEDVRVVLIKLADRLHSMRTLKYMPLDKQKRIAQETSDIYAPLANRLGIWQIKWELEDLSFRYLNADMYKKIAQLLDERRVDREQYIDKLIKDLKSALTVAKVSAKVSGRPKHIYSIWRKMMRKKVGFHQIFDVRAVRILVNDLASCYATLGIVHTLWKPIPGEFDDYIAMPKENMYQSLHTAVIGPSGRTLEIQIRTEDMHYHSEMGVAAHWVYKEGAKQNSDFERRIAWMRKLLEEWHEDHSDNEDLVERVKAELKEDRVYVLTPKGNVIDLPQGATVLDFAYYVHTEVGHRCRGAKVNGRIVPFSYALASGDAVEILTARTASPSRDWLSPYLGYLKTPRARAKLKVWLKKQDYSDNVITGRAALEREFHRLGISNINHESLASQFKFHKVDNFLAAIGGGEITNSQIAGALSHLNVTKAPIAIERLIAKDKPSSQTTNEVEVLGVGDLLMQMARCCKPVPYDPIVGYITRGRGVSIHRSDCSNLVNMEEEECERLIEVDWCSSRGTTYPVDIQIRAYDRQGLLRDITLLLTTEKINVIAVNTKTHEKNQMADLLLTIEIMDITQLSKILDKLGRIANIEDARRMAS